MFGTAGAREKYLASRQLANREQLDDTTTRSLKVEYWIDIAKQYADVENELDIDVGNELVNLYLYLREKLSIQHISLQ